MLISTRCPRCDTAYQVKEELRGKAMRCAVKTCEKLFLIAEAAPAPAPTTSRIEASNQQTGSVGDLVPLLPVEADPQPGSGFDLVPILPAEPAASDWRSAPPARRSEAKPAVEPTPPSRKSTQPAPKKSTAVPKRSPDDPDPVVKSAGEWTAPPPVRRRSNGESPVPAPLGASETAGDDHHSPTLEAVHHAEHHEPTAAPRTRLAKWVILPFLVLTVGVLVGGGVFILVFRDAEGKLRAKADSAYEAGTFRVAAELYKKLVDRYPESEDFPLYQFRAELADLRFRAKESDQDVPDLLVQIETFVASRAKDPLMPDHAAGLGTSLAGMLQEFADSHTKALNERLDKLESGPIDEKLIEILDQARPVIEKVKALKLPKDAKSPDWPKVEESFAKLLAAIDRIRQLNATIAALAKLTGQGNYRALVEAEDLLASGESIFPGISRSAKVDNLLTELHLNHLKNIRHSPDPNGKQSTKAASEEGEPALIFDPLIGGSQGNARRGTPVSLALARGVLYGLDRDTGRARWAMRVGIDTTLLPVRVPARVGSRERLLALSSDTNTLTALDNDGNTLWRYRLEAACLGQPVVVGENRAYLATVNGVVHEIELIEGKRLSTYNLGQRITLGGTHEPKSNRIYFPADQGCVYVLDVKDPDRKSILYSRHPAGSLRGEAVLVGPDGADAPGYLILPQTAGLDAVELRVFDLPIANRLENASRHLASSRSLKLEARLDGWTWFRPYHDPEKLVLLSDAGVLGLFGIHQKNNKDEVLFPMLPGGGLHLGSLLSSKSTRAQEQRRGRAEVVQLSGDDLWVLAANQFQRLKLAWDQETGPRVIPVWPKGEREVGSPLHAAQSFEDAFGKSSLVLVTQPPRRPACWASCYDDETGQLRWRRQLGVVCDGEPISLAAPGEKPVLLLLDQSGALFAVDPQRYKIDKDTQWISDARLTRLADGVDENPETRPTILRIDAASVYIIVSPGDGKELVVRHVNVEPKDRTVTVNSRRIDIPSPLWGTPAVVGAHLLLPLANEKIARIALPLTDKSNVREGFDWKANRATPEERGHVLALGGDRFLTTDGIRNLRVWEWPAKGIFKALPASRGDGPTLELSDRVLGAPIVVPGKQGDAVQIALADAGGMLRLLELQPDGALEEKRAWPLGGASSGPFVETVAGVSRIGCVVNRSKLVWIDPASKSPLWTHQTTDGASIVGQPRLAGDKLIVADESGQYVALDAAKGTASKGYRLTGSFAPAASPVALHADRLLAPLSDGTLLLLSSKAVEGK